MTNRSRYYVAGIVAASLTVTGVTSAQAQPAQPPQQQGLVQTSAAGPIVRLELFRELPGPEITGTPLLEILPGTTKDTPVVSNDVATRYLRVSVVRGPGADAGSRTYRAIVNPFNGRIFVVTTEGILTLPAFLSASGIGIGDAGIYAISGDINLRGSNVANSDVAQTVQGSPGVTGAVTTASSPAASAAPADRKIEQLTIEVLNAGAPIAQGTSNEFFIAPVEGTVDSRHSIEGTSLRLEFIGTATLVDVFAAYDRQLRSQGFEPVADAAGDRRSEAEITATYSRAEGNVRLTINRSAEGLYVVTVDFSGLANQIND